MTPQNSAKILIYHSNSGWPITAFFLFLTMLTVQAQEFDPQQQKQLQQGNPILTKQQVHKEAPWQQHTVFFMVKNNPKQAFKIFSDYEKQSDYVPRLETAKILTTISATENLVFYRIKNPWPIPATTYTMRHKLKLNSPLRISWKLESSNNLKEAYGFAEFRKFKEETLVQYQTFVWPNSPFAKMVRGRFTKDLLKTVKVLQKELAKK